MKSHTFSVVLLPILLALVSMTVGSRAFVGTKPRILPQHPSNRRNIVLREGTSGEDDSRTTTTTTTTRNFVFEALSTDRDMTPNQGTFFYNDEVISHLYGYMYLVGFFAAQDGLFLGNFLLLSSVTAWATQESLLPCNPRIPALTAAMTLGLTFVLRYGLGFEPPVQSLMESYQGPTESAVWFETIICVLNIGWGFFGTWRTKEQVNGATYGF